MSQQVINPTDDFKVQANHEWIGKDLRVKSDPIIDPGVGREVFIRSFKFGINPAFKGARPSKQDIFNMHWRQLRAILWGDGLVAREDINPRVEFMQGNKYRIFITCEPRMNTVVADKVRSLNEYLNPRKNKR